MIKLLKSIGLFTAALFSVAPGIASAAWLEARSKHFIVYGDGGEKQLASFTEKLEKFDFLLRRMTNTMENDAPNPVRVYLLARDAQVQAAARDRNVVGYYTTSERYAYALVSREKPQWALDAAPEDILFHEYTHHFMLHYFPAAYPAWYVEGFAEYFSTIKFKEDGGMQFGNAPTARVYELIKKPLYPLDKLFTNDTDALTRLDGSQYYGTAWLLTHFFQHNPARGPEFKRYIDDMVKGVPDITPDKYFAGGTAALTKEVSAYIKRPITISVYRPTDMPAFPISVRPVEEGQGALILQELAFMRGVPEDEQEKFAAEVRTKAALYPQSAHANALLADTELLVDRQDAALAAAERAIAIDPGLARAWSAKAEVMMARADKSDDEADWKAAQSAIVKANRADLEDPVPLAQFYRYRRMRGGVLPQVAYDGLYKAYTLLPQSPTYRFNFASSLAEQERYDEAVRILAPLAFSPHPSPMRDYAMTMRERYRSEAAPAKLADAAAKSD